MSSVGVHRTLRVKCGGAPYTTVRLTPMPTAVFENIKKIYPITLYNYKFHCAHIMLQMLNKHHYMYSITSRLHSENIYFPLPFPQRSFIF